MALFDKNSITNTDYDWFKNRLDNNFSIADDQKPKVIFGFNGIGKSTLFKCIKELNNNSVEFLEYGELKNILTKQKDELIISPNINQINNLNDQIESLKTAFDLKKNLKDNFGISTISHARNLGLRIQNAQRDGSFSGFVKAQSDISAIEILLGTVSPKVFIAVQNEIATVQNAQQELHNEKKHLLFHALNVIDSITDANETVCPVCGNSAVNLKQTIQNKMAQLNNVQSNLINKLKTFNVTVDANAINNMVTAYGQIDADIDFKADYLLCNGSSANYNNIQQNYIQIMALQAQLNPLLVQAQAGYNHIQNVLSSLEHDLIKYFGVSPANIISDPRKFTITIKFPREIKTYSSGELNLISFLYKIYSFLGSDKTIMILDDPVSSLDLVNHYKIAYEIVRNSSIKTLIILTHSVEFINVINSQYPNRFDYYYLEQSSGVISIQLIPIISHRSGNPNIITLDRLTDNGAFLGLINALKIRETDPSNIPIQTLFHYTVTSINLDGDPSRFSNHSLYALIDNFTTFVQGDFFTTSYLKVQYLCALRIWIEKKLYELIPTSNSVLQNRYLSLHSLNDKINCLFPISGASPVTIPTGLTRDALMSKKVMLNQGVHYYSQIMPFAYAINLSLDMLRDEIIELRTLLP